MSDWYYAVNDEQKGPINESELKANFATNKLSPTTLVWKEGMDNWIPANQTPAFSFRAAPAPANVQPATAPVATEAPDETTAPSGFSKVMSKLPNLFGPGETLEVDYDDAEKNKIYGLLAYVPLLWLVPMMAAPHSPFAKYHANQGLVLFILEAAIVIILSIFSTIAVFFYALATVVWILGLLHLTWLALMIVGILNAAQGKCVPLPVIGGLKVLR